MSNKIENQYRKRLAAVVSFIDEHLDEELSLEVLSEVSDFSRYHFLRQFTASFGISPHKFVRLRRMKRASFRLAYRAEHSIMEIALDSGYDGPEAFARSFKQIFGQTPSEFRAYPDWQRWNRVYDGFCEKTKFEEDSKMVKPDLSETVRVVDVEEQKVGLLMHRGDPGHLGDTIRQFISWRKSAGLHPSKSATFNIFYDDPEETPASEFRMGLCAATREAIADNDFGVEDFLIPAGRRAVIRHVGSDLGLGSSIRKLYRDWLPASGESPGDFPLYCQRVNLFPEVPEHEAIVDIYLPLRS